MAKLGRLGDVTLLFLPRGCGVRRELGRARTSGQTRLQAVEETLERALGRDRSGDQLCRGQRLKGQTRQPVQGPRLMN